MEVTFECINFWGDEIYKTKTGRYLVKLDDGYYTLSDNTDIDSDPDRKLKDGIVIIDKSID